VSDIGSPALEPILLPVTSVRALLGDSLWLPALSHVMSRLVRACIMTILVGGWHLWSPVRVGLFKFQVLVVRGWMVGEKKKAEEYSAAKGLLRVSTRLSLQVSGLGLASA
jgi:hypothetical protein